jgi:hypothetical protein
MSFEIPKNLLYFMAVLIAVGILLAVFILPMFFDLYLGRGFCKFLGNFFLKLLLGDSMLVGVSQGGVSAGCDLAIPF